MLCNHYTYERVTAYLFNACVLVHHMFAQVPMVRGSALVTHLYENANPVITPLCLTSVNGESISYQCPLENASKFH